MSWFLIVYDRSQSRSLSCDRYPPHEHDAAWDQRTALTLRHLREPNVEVVLIGAASESVVRRTHARYFQAPAPVVRDAMPAHWATPFPRDPTMRLPHALCLLSLACAPDPATCLAVDACPTDACIVLQGYRLDPPSACVAERRSFCVAGTDVDELETVATDADGARWLFGSTTIPEGWTPVDSAPEESGANAWPDCP